MRSRKGCHCLFVTWHTPRSPLSGTCRGQFTPVWCSPEGSTQPGASLLLATLLEPLSGTSRAAWAPPAASTLQVSAPFSFSFPHAESLDTSDTPQPESPAASEAPQTPKLQAWMRLGAHTKHRNSSTLRPTASDLQQQASSCLQWGAAQRASRGTPAGTQPLAAPGTAQGSPARRVPTARLLSAFQILPDDNLDV